MLAGSVMQETPYVTSKKTPATTFIANYDTESPSCLEHLEAIVNVHLSHKVPATFFIVSDILNKTNKQRVVRLLDNPLFEVGSHSKSHQLILPHPLNPRTGNPREELIDSKKRLEDIFGRTITGYATPYAYVERFKGHTGVDKVALLNWPSPWPIGRFDPKMIALDMTFAYVKKQNYPAGTFGSLYKTLTT